MKLSIVNDSIIRVTHVGDETDVHDSLIIDPACSSQEMTNDGGAYRTKDLIIEHDQEFDRLIFKDHSGTTLLAEPENPRCISPSNVDEGAGFEVTQKFILQDDEGIYGLGQFQNGHMNYRGQKVELVQSNREIVVQMLVSTNGWGILWDNYSHTVIDDTGDDLTIWSEAGNGLDYYFIYGPSMDEIIAQYRTLTGAAPLFGKWAYGFWQSKERYTNRDDLVGTIREYRERKIPIDNIVQDWRYWGKHGWSAMKFDEDLFPEPKEMIRQIQEDYHAHLMVSIWPVIGTKSEAFKELDEAGHALPENHWANAQVYDAFSEEAREIYWKHAKKGLFDLGVDAWWMDGTEPELTGAFNAADSKAKIVHNGRPSIGSWYRYLNAFSLMTTKGVYENQRKATSDKRVFILSRSSSAGQQKYGAAAWSGDIPANWEVFRTQISAGLNFCMAGNPYWTTDIGAFFTAGQGANYPDGCKDDSYKELYLRWYQYGAFNPLFRSHGTTTPREVWQFGDEGHWAYDTQVAFDNLRYRLMPYIYSLAWMITDSGYTMMRGLPMDFPDDIETHNIDTQFMFGPAMMACPVTHGIHHPRQSSDFPIHRGEWGYVFRQPAPIAGQYYSGLNFDTLEFEQRVGQIDFDWSGAPPAGLPEENYSIRWTGTVTAKEDGLHNFCVLSDHGVRLYIDGEKVIDQWDKRKREKISVPRELTAGASYELVVEYCHELGNTATIVVSWSSPARERDLKLEQDTTPYREVYLPASADWYDFWTGEKLAGGKTIQRDCPIEIMPLYVRAGSIVPMGPYLQYASEKPADPIELRIYPGADGTFTLYEDEGDNYNYEDGVHSTIRFDWDDASGTLTVGERQGEFPGMLQERTINVVLVEDGTGIDVAPSTEFSSSIHYTGASQSVTVSR